jgi:hypothetical protein
LQPDVHSYPSYCFAIIHGYLTKVRPW